MTSPVPAMSPLQVSSISLSSWRASPSQTERDRMAAVWEEAFSSHGLLYLTEHGLTDLYKRVAEVGSVSYFRI